MGHEVHKGRGYQLVRENDGDGRFRTDFKIDCVCGASERIHANPQMNPDGVAVIFRRKGWHVHDNNPAHNKCPDCVNLRGRRRAPQEAPRMKQQPAAPSQSPVIRSIEARAATPAESRRIFAALDEVFLEDEGRYRTGHSDRTVGEKLDIPWATVEQLREASGLKINGDPELLALKTDFEAVQSMVAEIGKRLMAFESKAARR